ncbi:MAG: prolyl oligopeptidase family serine peptidase, partial [Gemmatimonas sp.]
MSKTIFARALAFIVASLAATATISAQSAAPGTGGGVASKPAANGARRTLTLADYGAWKRITSTALSPDGKWMAFAYQPNDGDATLHIQSLDNEKRYSIPVGSLPSFGDDGAFAGYFVSPPERRPGTGRGGAPGAPAGAPPATTPPATTPPGGRGAGAATPATRRAELLDLASGEKFSVGNAATFKFAEGGRWAAVRTNKAVATATHNGADLILRDLKTGTTRNIGNVNYYDFDKSGTRLAYTVDAADRLGNGVYLVDLASGETRMLSSAAKEYDALVWADSAPHLAVIRGEKATTRKQRDNAVLAWLDLGSPKTRSIVFDSAAQAASSSGMPAGMVVSEFSTPRFSKDGARLFVGIKEQEAEPARGDEAQPNVDVWHFNDPEPQSVQMVRLAGERRSTYTSVLDLNTRTIRRLADSTLRNVTPTPNSRWGIGRIDTTYRGAVSWGGSKADYYRVNLATGERTLIAKGLSRTMGTSPDSRTFLYLQNGNVMAYNMETATSARIDAAAKISFVDAEDDHPYEVPTYGVAGWAKDGKSVLLNHRYDVWQVALDGSNATNLTGGAGEAGKIRFRIANLNAARGGRGGGGGGGAGGDDDGVDLAKPLTYTAYGEWTKKSGYFQGMAGKAPAPLVWSDKAIGSAQASERGDRVIFTQQTFTEFPDWWSTNRAFAAPKKVTDANPQIVEYAWGSKQLVDYTDARGNKLQATLTLPANYEPGKQYPMLVYFYEKMSNTHNQFSTPVYDDRPHVSVYASDGYLVLQPDVVYTVGRPGSSALDDVTSAVRKVIDMGMADPKRIGLQGHSWGGYQSSFIVTQTDMFAAVVTGAPPTNLMSFYDQLYKQTGTVQQGIMELGQVRMGIDSTPWTAKALYESQSPVHNVQNIKTPFLILHGTEDGAVDWVQGLEYFNAARRNGKNVILLSYP